MITDQPFTNHIGLVFALSLIPFAFTLFLILETIRIAISNHQMKKGRRFNRK